MKQIRSRDVQSWYERLNAVLIGHGLEGISAPEITGTALAEQVAPLADKLESMKADPYYKLAAYSDWGAVVKGAIMREQTPVGLEATLSSVEATIICRNTATNSHGTCSKGTNSDGANGNGSNSNGTNSDGTRSNGACSNGTKYDVMLLHVFHSNETKNNGGNSDGTQSNGLNRNTGYYYGANSNGQNSDGTYSNGSRSYGKYSNGSYSNGTKSNGVNTDGGGIDTGNVNGSNTN